MKRSSLRCAAMVAVATALLSGCATGYLLDNNVQSFSGLQALPANPTYRFERLPSQAGQPAQNHLEALADPALFRAGLRRDDASPRYAVQVSARLLRTLSPWADPWDSGWGWGGFGYGGRRASLGLGFGWGGPFPRMEQAWFHREVGVVVREIGTNQVVYESHATSDGPWIENNTVMSAMFDAALQGFPNPPAGPRRVNIQLGGPKQHLAATPTPATAPAASPAVNPAPAPAPAK